MSTPGLSSPTTERTIRRTSFSTEATSSRVSTMNALRKASLTLVHKLLILFRRLVLADFVAHGLLDIRYQLLDIFWGAFPRLPYRTSFDVPL